MTYTFDQAAALLDLGRNTLTRRLRDLKLLDKHNMPTGPYRGRGLFEVANGTFQNAGQESRPYTKTLITEKGMGVIRLKLTQSALSSGTDEKIPGSPLEPVSDRVIATGTLTKENPMNSDNTLPAAKLHDIGELIVINDEHGRVHHRCAVVLVFDTPEQAAACIKAKALRLVPAADLNPDVTEVLRHG